MPDTPSTNHPQLIIDFVRAVCKHWVGFVTSSIIAAVLWWSQGVGWFAPRHWVVWSIAVLGLLVSVYQAWVDEHWRVEALTGQLKTENADRKRELIQIVTALRRVQAKVIYWRDITQNKWGLVKDAEKLLPEGLPAILYEAGNFNPALRTTMEIVEDRVGRAESIIAQFFGQPPNYRQEQLMKQAYIQLDEVLPPLSSAIAEFEAFEKGLH